MREGRGRKARTQKRPCTGVKLEAASGVEPPMEILQSCAALGTSSLARLLAPMPTLCRRGVAASIHATHQPAIVTSSSRRTWRKVAPDSSALTLAQWSRGCLYAHDNEVQAKLKLGVSVQLCHTLQERMP